MGAQQQGDGDNFFSLSPSFYHHSMVEFVLSNHCNAIPFLILLKWLFPALTSALTSRCLCPDDDWTSLLGCLVGIADSQSSPAFSSLGPLPSD